MKKLFLIIILILAMPFAPAFAASVEFGGDLEINGVMLKDHDFDSDTDSAEADTRFYDQELNLTAEAAVGDVKIYAGISVYEGEWGTIFNAASSADVVLNDDDYAYYESYADQLPERQQIMGSSPRPLAGSVIRRVKPRRRAGSLDRKPARPS